MAFNYSSARLVLLSFSHENTSCDCTCCSSKHSTQFYCLPLEFPSLTKLTRHVREHAGERSYPCKHCDRSFTKSHHYTRSVLTLTFLRMGELKIHLDITHFVLDFLLFQCYKGNSSLKDVVK